MPQVKRARYPQRGLHAGYRYQDLIAALAACRVLMRGDGLLQIEAGRIANDAFDDVILTLDDELRIQVKHVERRDALDAKAFTGTGARLAIAGLVTARAGRSQRLRALTTWTMPDPVPAWLRTSSIATTFGHGSAAQLNPDVIWPLNAKPIWTELESSSRDEFVAFASEFVLELNLPAMSGMLTSPGPCERDLVEQLRALGVERHPNNRDALDVASRLLEVTSSARGREHRDFDFPRLVHEIGLQIDRGNVPQAYPLDPARYVEPTLTPGDLASSLLNTRRIVLVGEPGAGKSWLLETLSKELPRAEWVVARHYCYLAPGDLHTQARVALDTLSGNLLHEMLGDPELRGLEAGFGADFGDLQRVLGDASAKLASGSGRRLCLIVDGLDHVARVNPEPGQRRWNPTEVTDALAGLELAENVRLIVGSQPGDHLASLREAGADFTTVPPFGTAEVRSQLERASVFERLVEHGLAADIDELVYAVSTQADGNPLYVTFLAQQVIAALDDARSVVPSALVGAIAAPAGDLKAYYEYLIADDADGVAGILLEYLAPLEFAVTLDDLVEILPTFGRVRIAQALAQLGPVLASVASHGGVRIYHESLRRHLISRVAARGDSLNPTVGLLVNWLEGRGFFQDFTSFRFLLPLLRSAGRVNDLLARVGVDFVAESVVHLQPYDAVTDNLRLAAFTAAEVGDLPKLAALSELRRAAHTAYEEKLADIATYAQACIELFGADRLAQQLVYEDRAVYDLDTGLQLCTLIDRAGVAAPWSAYAGQPARSEHVGGAGAREVASRRTINRLRGRMRVDGRDAVVALVVSSLNRPSVKWRQEFVGAVANLLDEVFGFAALLLVIELADPADPRLLYPFRMHAADRAAQDGDSETAIRLSQQLLSEPIDLEDLTRLLKLGVPAPELASHVPPENETEAGLFASPYSVDRRAAQAILASSTVRAAAGDDLIALRGRLVGDGWYRQWLRFVIDEATATSSTDVVRALVEVARDVDASSGQPRAFDLYAIRAEIRQSFERALDRVDDCDADAAVRAVLEVSRATTVYIQRSQAGPLPMWTALELLLPHAARIDLAVVTEWIEQQWTQEYYGLHAEAHLGLARLFAAAGDHLTAAAHWRKAGLYLAGYGTRRDITLFAPIEAVEALPMSYRDSALMRLRELRRLVDRAVYHSDGKDTRYLPEAWLRALANADASLAADVLAADLRAAPPIASWIEEDGLSIVIERGQDQLPPLMAHALWRCVPARRKVDRRLEAVKRLANIDPRRGLEAFGELLAAVEGDPDEPGSHVTPAIMSTAAERGWSLPAARDTSELDNASDEWAANDAGPSRSRCGPFLAGVGNFASLVTWARGFYLDSRLNPIDAVALAAELALKSTDLGLTGEQLVAVIETLVHHQTLLKRVEVVEKLAFALADSSPSVAADLLTLAWCGGHERGGIERFGGLEQRALLERAAELDRDRTIRRLGTEVAHVIDRDEYSLGMMRRLCEALVVLGEPERALECFDAALEVIRLRLPATGGEPEIWVEPPEQAAPVTAAFARLLAAMAHDSDFDRRAAVYAGLSEIVQSQAGAVLAAAESFLDADFTYTDVVGFLELMHSWGPAAHDITRQLEQPLTAAADAMGFGLRSTARLLLGAIDKEVSASAEPPIERVGVATSAIDQTTRWDTTRRIEELTVSWRGIRRVVAERFAWLWESEAEDIARRQDEAQFSNARPWAPAKPQFHWRHEILECALHDSISEFRRHHLARGAWRRRSEQDLRDLIRADAAATAARGRSRTLRPSELPLPGEAVCASHPLVELHEGQFRGWTVVGYHETALEEAQHGKGLHTVAYGGVTAGTWRVTPADLPFSAPAASFRWHAQSPRRDAHRKWIVPGPIATWWVQHDALAFDRGLTLAQPVLDLLELSAAAPPAALDLVDQAGVIRAAWRRWWMTPISYDYGPTTPKLSGGVLLLEPDARALVENAAESELAFQVTVDSRELDSRLARRHE